MSPPLREDLVGGYSSTSGGIKIEPGFGEEPL